MAITRILVFDNGRSQKRFEVCYAAILLGAPKGAGRGLEALRREARILDALEGASTVDPQAPPGAALPARIVTPGARLALAQPELELLARYLEAVEWAPVASRDVVDAADWLSAAAHEDP